MAPIDVTRHIKEIARGAGADLVACTTREILGSEPPSADPRYLLADATSVVAYAVALDFDAIRRFQDKSDWRSHCRDRKNVVQRLYEIGDAIVTALREYGHRAVQVEVNNSYRPEAGAADVSEMTEFVPDFSLRYAALAAGLGRLGWSGNLMTPEYGAMVELGAVITSANLSPDAAIPDEEHPCDACKMCSLVCPVEMVPTRAAMTVKIAGLSETIAKKRTNTCCWIGCTGYEGAHPSGKWSNWSPYRLGIPLPDDKDELDALCTRLQKDDPQMSDGAELFVDYRRTVFDPKTDYYTVCGFCRSVCWPRREDRIANRRRIVSSGHAALRQDGEHVRAPDDAKEVETPFGVRVLVSRENPPIAGRGGDAVAFPLDREVIALLQRRARS